MATKSKSHVLADVGIFAAGAVAAAAGTLFLYGKNAKHNRKSVRGWMVKAKGEILDEMEQMREMNREGYDVLVDKVTRAYGKLKHVNQKDLQNITKELKSHWKEISKQLAKSGRSLGKKVKSKRK
jgi:hypothetical protein